jgi:hypothetical protein
MPNENFPSGKYLFIIFRLMADKVTDSSAETPFVFAELFENSAPKMKGCTANLKGCTANSHLPRRGGTASFNF